MACRSLSRPREYTNWIAKREIAVHQDMSEASPVIFRIRKGEWVTGLTGVVVTTKPGEARVSRPVTLGGRQARKGDLNDQAPGVPPRRRPSVDRGRGGGGEKGLGRRVQRQGQADGGAAAADL